MAGAPDLLSVATLGLSSSDLGKNLTGQAAREAADKAKKDQQAYQSDVEKRLYNKTVLDAATLDMQKKRNAQKSAMSLVGGRAGTILTSGLSGSSQMDQGKKVLLGE